MCYFPIKYDKKSALSRVFSNTNIYTTTQLAYAVQCVRGRPVCNWCLITLASDRRSIGHCSTAQERSSVSVRVSVRGNRDWPGSAKCFF